MKALRMQEKNTTKEQLQEAFRAALELMEAGVKYNVVIDIKKANWKGEES